MGDNSKSSWTDKLSCGWGLILSGASIFSTGFGAGFYIKSVLNDIETNNLILQHKQELLNKQSEYENKIYDLREKLYLMQKEALNDDDK